MRKVLFMAVMLYMTAVGAKAQTENVPLHFDASFTMGMPAKDLSPMGASFNLNFSPINRLSIHALAHTDFFIPKNGATKDYNNATNIGGGLGYQLISNERGRLGALELRGTASVSVGKSDFANSTYSLGLYFYKHPTAQRFQPIVGVGFSMRNFHGNQSTCYAPFVSLGFRF